MGTLTRLLIIRTKTYNSSWWPRTEKVEIHIRCDRHIYIYPIAIQMNPLKPKFSCYYWIQLSSNKTKKPTVWPFEIETSRDLFFFFKFSFLKPAGKKTLDWLIAEEVIIENGCIQHQKFPQEIAVIIRTHSSSKQLFKYNIIFQRERKKLNMKYTKSKMKSEILSVFCGALAMLK